MSSHIATIGWKRTTSDFSYDTYNREHAIRFPSGQSLDGSAAPEYLGSDACVDPEESLIAALSSCHMLTFLAIAAKKRFTVDGYQDEATGYLEKNDAGKFAITRIELRPTITFSGDRQPDADVIAAMHDKAHEHCFIANSISAQVTVLLPSL